MEKELEIKLICDSWDMEHGVEDFNSQREFPNFKHHKNNVYFKEQVQTNVVNFIENFVNSEFKDILQARIWNKNKLDFNKEKILYNQGIKDSENFEEITDPGLLSWIGKLSVKMDHKISIISCTVFPFK